MLTIGTVQKMNKYFDQNPNMTWYGVVWCTTEWVIYENFSIPCQYEYDNGKELMFYSIMYNASLADNGFLKTFAFPVPVDPKMLGLKQSIDNGIMKYLGKKKEMPS